MKRIVIIGTTGSGKTTLAKTLAAKLGLVHIDLDDFHWLPGWKERPREDFRRLLIEAARVEKWAVAGNYKNQAMDITWPAADTLIWLDMPFWINFWRLLERTVRRAYTGEMICNGNTEPFFKQFYSKDSLLLWFLKTWPKNRKMYNEVFANPQSYPHLTLVRLRSYRQIREFLDKL